MSQSTVDWASIVGKVVVVRSLMLVVLCLMLSLSWSTRNVNRHPPLILRSCLELQNCSHMLSKRLNLYSMVDFLGFLSFFVFVAWESTCSCLCKEVGYSSELCCKIIVKAWQIKRNLQEEKCDEHDEYNKKCKEHNECSWGVHQLKLTRTSNVFPIDDTRCWNHFMNSLCSSQIYLLNPEINEQTIRMNNIESVKSNLMPK